MNTVTFKIYYTSVSPHDAHVKHVAPILQTSEVRRNKKETVCLGLCPLLCKYREGDLQKKRKLSEKERMANLPQSLSMNAPFGGGPSASSPSAAAGAGANKDRKMASAEHLVLDLSNPDLRENALLELSKVNLSSPLILQKLNPRASVLAFIITFLFIYIFLAMN